MVLGLLRRLVGAGPASDGSVGRGHRGVLRVRARIGGPAGSTVGGGGERLHLAPLPVRRGTVGPGVDQSPGRAHDTRPPPQQQDDHDRGQTGDGGQRPPSSLRHELGRRVVVGAREQGTGALVGGMVPRGQSILG